MDYDVSFEKGNVVLEAKKEGVASVKVEVSSDFLLDKIAEAIPGQIDDLIIEKIKNALKIVG
jgi:hypothetical protein